MDFEPGPGMTVSAMTGTSRSPRIGARDDRVFVQLGICESGFWRGGWGELWSLRVIDQDGTIEGRRHHPNLLGRVERPLNKVCRRAKISGRQGIAVIVCATITRRVAVIVGACNRAGTLAYQWACIGERPIDVANGVTMLDNAGIFSNQAAYILPGTAGAASGIRGADRAGILSNEAADMTILSADYDVGIGLRDITVVNMVSNKAADSRTFAVDCAGDRGVGDLTARVITDQPANIGTSSGDRAGDRGAVDPADRVMTDQSANIGTCSGDRAGDRGVVDPAAIIRADQSAHQ